MPTSLRDKYSNTGSIEFISGRKSIPAGTGTLLSLTAPAGYKILLTYLASAQSGTGGETGITITKDGVDVVLNQTLCTSTDQSGLDGFFICSGNSGVTFDGGTNKNTIDTIFAAAFPPITGKTIEIKKTSGTSQTITYSYAYVRQYE